MPATKLPALLAALGYAINHGGHAVHVPAPIGQKTGRMSKLEFNPAWPRTPLAHRRAVEFLPGFGLGRHG